VVVAWVPAVTAVLSHHDSASRVAVFSGVFGGSAVLGTLLFGASLGRRREWGYLAWCFLVGLGAIALFIFFSFANTEPANAPDDPGLGLGAMLVTAMVAPVLAAFLWLGGVSGFIARRFGTPSR
jgi:hypothetical protein